MITLKKMQKKAMIQSSVCVCVCVCEGVCVYAWVCVFGEEPGGDDVKLRPK